ACDASAVPLLDEIDPSGAYLSWSAQLKSEHEIADVREVFEFVEGEADISIEADGQPEVSDADIAALLSKALGTPAPTEPEAPAETVAEAVPQEPAHPEPASPEAVAAPAPATEAAKHETKHAPAALHAQTTIRVEFDRVDRLINLVG